MPLIAMHQNFVLSDVFMDGINRFCNDFNWYEVDLWSIYQIQEQAAFTLSEKIFRALRCRFTRPVSQKPRVIRFFAGVDDVPAVLPTNRMFMLFRTNEKVIIYLNHGFLIST
jgi:hypothetical protein